jgi:hypothetical protein
MVETIIKEGGLCLMLDGEHKGRIGVCVGIYPQESEARKYTFVFSDGNEYFIDNEEIPRNFKKLSN